MLFLFLFFIKSSFTSDEDGLTSVLDEIRQLRKEVQELKKIIQEFQDTHEYSDTLPKSESNGWNYRGTTHQGGYSASGFGPMVQAGVYHPPPERPITA